MDHVRFEELNLSPELLKAVDEMGFEEATAIQTAAIPLILAGRDVIGHSQTGTGKTAAFGLPAIAAVDPDNRRIQVLILCPTRELAVQASEELKKFSKYRHGIRVLPVYGGQPIDRQFRGLQQGAQIVVGTPGRVMDHMRRGTIRLEALKIMVLDEADEMLNIGFREDIETILRECPKQRQTILFSATMSKEILAITKLYQNDPELVKMEHKQLTVPSIEQSYYEVRPGRKAEALCRLLDAHDPKLSLVFCNTKRMVDDLVAYLSANGYAAEGLHGDMRQTLRDRVMDRFRSRRIDVLVATDVAARGIDVDDIEAVFNYDVPQDEEYYVHRIGRTGRMGKVGHSYTFVVGRAEILELRDIMRFINVSIELKLIPFGDEVADTRSQRTLEAVRTALREGSLENGLRIVETLMEEDFTSVEVAAALAKLVDATLNTDVDKAPKRSPKEDINASTAVEKPLPVQTRPFAKKQKGYYVHRRKR
jgi:ATP-dependent RNA helicase DeaD